MIFRDRRFVLRTFAVTISVALIALIASTISPAQAVPAIDPQSSAVEEMEWQMVALINAERAKVGAPPLTMQFDVHQYARHHARQMASRTEIWHDMNEYRNWLPGGSIRWAENVAWNTSMEEAHKWLLNSPGHRANLLNKGYHYIGVGIYKSGDYFYVSQNFLGTTGGDQRVNAAVSPASNTATSATPTTTTSTTTTTTTTTSPPVKADVCTITINGVSHKCEKSQVAGTAGEPVICFAVVDGVRAKCPL